MRRVVITGMGIVSPLGAGLQHNWNSLLNAKSGISRISGFETEDLACQIAGQVPQDGREGALNLDDFIEPKEQRKLDRFIQLGIVAGIEAVEDSGWKPQDIDAQDRSGVMIGSGIGGLQTIVETTELLNERGPRRISPFFIPSALINLISGQISIRYGYRGPNHAVVTACSTGAHAGGDAARRIAFDDADVMPEPELKLPDADDRDDDIDAEDGSAVQVPVHVPAPRVYVISSLVSSSRITPNGVPVAVSVPPFNSVLSLSR